MIWKDIEVDKYYKVTVVEDEKKYFYIFKCLEIAEDGWNAVWVINIHGKRENSKHFIYNAPLDNGQVDPLIEEISPALFPEYFI